MADQMFVSRCRLWTALFDLIPEADADEAARLAAGLDAAYWMTVREQHEAVSASLTDAQAQIATLETRLAELSGAGPLAPTSTVTH